MVELLAIPSGSSIPCGAFWTCFHISASVGHTRPMCVGLQWCMAHLCRSSSSYWGVLSACWTVHSACWTVHGACWTVHSACLRVGRHH